MNNSDHKRPPRARADNVDRSAREIARSAHGTQRGPHAKGQRERSGWSSLTRTELKVAEWVNEGLTNPQIADRMQLSRRTVATHVSHILKKLDVNSRTDIAASLTQARLAAEVDRAAEIAAQAEISAQQAAAAALRPLKTRSVVPSATSVLGVAARLLPADDRARYAEEYRSELWDLSQAGAGHFGQLRYAFCQFRKALPMGFVLRSPRRRSSVP